MINEQVRYLRRIRIKRRERWREFPVSAGQIRDVLTTL